jgi:hypothetical protein
MIDRPVEFAVSATRIDRAGDATTIRPASAVMSVFNTILNSGENQ